MGFLVDENGWKTKTGGDVSHKELWQELIELLKTIKVDWHKYPDT